MTQASKLKTLVRARAAKTGESYSAARRQVLSVRPKTATVAAESKPESVTPSSAVPVRDPRVPRGELSDGAARKSTGHGLDHWFDVLDTFGRKHGHTKAAEYLCSAHKVPGWHAQMITVTWERKRGLRQENQSCAGTFQVSVSRAIGAPVEWVVDFFNDAKTRKAWLRALTPALSKALEEAFAKGKSMELKKPGYARMRYTWLSSVVELRVNAKTGSASTVVADSSGLPDADGVAVRREAFAQALNTLRDRAGA